MFSILKDVIAAPDITTLNTHHKLGISGYTYRLDHSCRLSGGLVHVHLVEFRSMTTLTAHLLEPSSLDHGESSCSPLALVDLMAIKRSCWLTTSEELLPLCRREGFGFVLVRHKLTA